VNPSTPNKAKQAMNIKTRRRRICDLADKINNRIKGATGLSFRDQVLLVAGFITGFFGLQTAFIFIVWGWVILTFLKFFILCLKDTPEPDKTGIEGATLLPPQNDNEEEERDAFFGIRENPATGQ